MADKLSMSLDDIVKSARAEKDASKGKGKDAGQGKGQGKGNSKGIQGGIKKKEPAPQKKAEKKPKPEKKEREPLPPAEPNEVLYVGNLPFTSEAAALETHLSTIASCTVDIKKRKNDKPMGFAIVTFADTESATKVVEGMADTEFEGRKLLVRFARPEKKKAEE